MKLVECLESIYQQTYLGIQVIIETEGSIVEARKRGIAKALGEYICLVDSDQVLPPNVIEDCVDICKIYDGVTWAERALSPSTICEKIIDYDKMLFHNACDDDPIYGAAEPRFFKAEFIKNLDFSKLPPITFELSMVNKQVRDMGAKIAFAKNVVVYHHEPRTFRELFRKFFRYGYYYIPSLKYGKDLVINHSKPRRVYFNPTSLQRPMLYVGLWYHYLIKASGAGLGALWYLCKNQPGWHK
jgi:glycosyltransferase involved in cell wall biosynthesis